MGAPMKVTKHGNVRWRVLRKEVDGKIVARFFERKEDALRYSSSTGSDSVPRFLALSDGDRGRLLACLEKAGSIDRLEGALTTHLSAQPTVTKPLWEAVTECASVKERGGRSAIYISNFLTALRHLDRLYPGRAVSSFTPKELQQWLDLSGWGAETKRTFLSRVETFFGWCVAMGYCGVDPTVGVQAPRWVAKRPVILTVEEVRKVLATVLRVDPPLTAYFALGFFSGIRPAEMRRLRRDHIKEVNIEVESELAKTRSRRLVEIRPNLREWLALPNDMPWSINSTWRRRFRRVIEATGLRWTADVMRHSYISYALPLHGAAHVAMEAGNSESVIFRHYRELVTKDAAAAYWAITPSTLNQPLTPSSP